MISVILPIRNEVTFISNAVNSILKQEISDHNYEILIADGMSTDGTRQIIKTFQKKNKNIFLFDNQKKIVSTGFNIALTKAKGNIIIRLDGHAEFPPDYFKKCLKALIKKKTYCVGGIIIYRSKGIIGESIKIAQSSNFGVGGVTFRKKNIKAKFVDTLAFGAYDRKIFELMGGYDEELIKNQDDEFNFRMNQKGYKIWIDPQIKSVYHSRDSFRKLFMQYFLYGFYKVRVMQKRNGFSSWRHMVPAAFIICLIFSIAHKFTNLNITTFDIIPQLYIVLNIIFAIIEISKSDERYTFKKIINLFFSLILSVLIIHLSYGFGFILGFIYFIKKWKNNKLIDSYFNKNYFIENNVL